MATNLFLPLFYITVIFIFLSLLSPANLKKVFYKESLDKRIFLICHVWIRFSFLFFLSFFFLVPFIFYFFFSFFISFLIYFYIYFRWTLFYLHTSSNLFFFLTLCAQLFQNTYYHKFTFHLFFLYLSSIFPLYILYFSFTFPLYFLCISLKSGDIQWSEFSYTLPMCALVIGILSALLGIGGGELMGPLLLNLKVRTLYFGVILVMLFRCVFLSLSLSSSFSLFLFLSCLLLSLLIWFSLCLSLSHSTSFHLVLLSASMSCLFLSCIPFTFHYFTPPQHNIPPCHSCMT